MLGLKLNHVKWKGASDGQMDCSYDFAGCEPDQTLQTIGYQFVMRKKQDCCLWQQATGDHFTDSLWAYISNLVEIIFALILYSNDTNRPQIYTSHDSRAIVTCAKL